MGRLYYSWFGGYDRLQVVAQTLIVDTAVRPPSRMHHDMRQFLAALLRNITLVGQLMGHNRDLVNVDSTGRDTAHELHEKVFSSVRSPLTFCWIYNLQACQCGRDICGVALLPGGRVSRPCLMSYVKTSLVWLLVDGIDTDLGPQMSCNNCATVSEIEVYARSTETPKISSKTKASS